MPRIQPFALPPALPSELLTYVLTHRTTQATLIICQPRANFLTSLLNSIDQTSPIPPPQNLDEPTDPITSPPEPAPTHPLLIPTLHQIASSRSIKLVFIPTVSHLRAYLSAFEEEEASEPVKEERQVPLIVVYGLVGLHSDTSEWSAQGLGNSLSLLVEVGDRCGRGVVCIEERATEEVRENLGAREEDEVVDDEESEERKWKQACKVWEQKVPMLNGSVRRAGMTSEDEAWSGRTVEVGRIFARWFRFGRGDWA